jgi:hypothetical protein
MLLLLRDYRALAVRSGEPKSTECTEHVRSIVRMPEIIEGYSNCTRDRS